MHKKERSSFTTGFRLVDLLIGVVCVGFLLSLFLPSVGGPRRAARRSICLNNVRQLILACHNYQSANLKFPSASGDADQNVGASYLVSILPYLDQQYLDDDYQNGIDDSTALSFLLTELSVYPIPLLYCPNEKQINAPDFGGQDQYTTHYYASCGPNSDPDELGYLFSYNAGRNTTQAIGLSGVFSPWSSKPADPNTPAVFDHKYGKTFDEIRDGSSNTIALFESSRIGGKNSASFNRRRGWAFGHTTVGEGSNIRYVFSGKSMVHKINSANAAAGWNDLPISSNHDGGAQIAMADGSAKFVNENISIEILRAASSIDDGEFDELE